MTHLAVSGLKNRHDFRIQWVPEPFDWRVFAGMQLSFSQSRSDDEWCRSFWYAAYSGRVDTMKNIAAILPIEQLALYVFRGDTPLHAAARKAQNGAIAWLSKRGCYIDARNERGETPLMCLLLEKDEIPESDRKSSAQALLKLGALPDLRDRSGHTARSLLLARGWDIVPPPSREQRVFQAVDGVNSDELAKALKEFKPGECCRTSTGHTPFHVLLVMDKRASLLSKKEKMVRQLAEVFDINAKDGAGSTALFAAVMGLEYRFAGFLLQHKANPNLLSGENQKAPLHVASTSVFVELLLSYKADPNLRQGSLKATPLLTAARAGRISAMKALLKARADSNLKDALGNTVLHECPNIECAELFLKNRDLIDAQNVLGDTPLHKAIRREAFPLVEALLDAGASLVLKTKMEKQTPLQLAKELLSDKNGEDADALKEIVALLKTREESSCILS